MPKIIQLPNILAIDSVINGNSIRQLYEPTRQVEANIANYKNRTFAGKIIIPTNATDDAHILVVEKSVPFPDGYHKILAAQPARLEGDDQFVDLSTDKWHRHPGIVEGFAEAGVCQTHLDETIASWKNAFSYLEENEAEKIKGLRLPQIGAIHAVHAHWAVSEKPATIVMPTGTGKTETMLSVLISKECEKLMVIVPTDALRTQIADKFLTLGILKDVGCRVLSGNVLHPVVGVLKHKPRDTNEVDEFFGKCHVIVTTSHIAGQCAEEIQERMAFHCPFLFVDEAHHIAASTWSAFKEKFSARRIVQFTATPFREDEKPVEGKIIFKYPLKKAQDEGYFRPIQFKPVVEFDPAKADEAIAAKAVEQLRADADKNHILMARVASVERAKKVFALYQKYGEFNPVEIHTGIKSKKEREAIRQKIVGRESRIVVCVDMLGEGFDLPELKIAAFHDIKKSLAITLQLAGRFTRARADLGQATFIANLADVSVREELRKLYRHDTDWNALLPQLSDDIIEEQICLRDFVEGFANFPDDIPLNNIRPAFSTVIYKTKCTDWLPDNFKAGLPGLASCERIHHDVNKEKDTLIVVAARKVPIDWADVKEIYNWDWELFVLHWDKAQNLLFVNSSSNSGEYKNLATAVAGEDIELVKEQNVFRCFYGVNRLKFQNVGLSEQLGRLVRYTGRMGADVEMGMSEAQKQNARKSVLSGSGFENGRKVMVGASRKGRIWSLARRNVQALTRWCRSIGAKVTDETIDPDEILRGTLELEIVSERPPKMPIAVEWNEEIYKEAETAFYFVFEDESEFPLYEAELNLKSADETGDLKFELFTETANAEVTLSLSENKGIKDCRFTVEGNKKVWVRYRANVVALEEFFYANPPVFWFVDGSSLEGNKFTALKKVYPPYDREKIRTLNWTGINLKKESQDVTKEADSIQYRLIEELKRGDYDVIFDDDDSGESADVVTIKVEELERGHIINVEFYHCKFSAEETAGARIKDLYEVCGQAQKSVHWGNPDKQTELFTHLLRREPRKRNGLEYSRFERGDRNGLFVIREMSRVCPVRLKIFVVQPGFSKSKASEDQLRLLSVTENYLMETYKIPFNVIANF